MKKFVYVCSIISLLLLLGLCACTAPVNEEPESQTYEEAYAYAQETPCLGTPGLSASDNYTYWMYYVRYSGENESTSIVIFIDHSAETVYIYYGLEDERIKEMIYVKD